MGAGQFVDLDYYFESPSSAPFIIDCGSNIGMSILFFKSLYPDATVYGFEPAAQTFAALERNVQANGLRDVTLHRAAIGATRGTVPFFESPIVGGLTASTAQERGSEGRTTVEQVPLSSFIDRRVHLLKVDIEGAEAELLSDLIGTQKLALIDQMILEYHHHIRASEDRLATFLGSLEDAGFGYQIRASLRSRGRLGEFQDVWIHAYRKSSEDSPHSAASR